MSAHWAQEQKFNMCGAAQNVHAKLYVGTRHQLGTPEA